MYVGGWVGGWAGARASTFRFRSCISAFSSLQKKITAQLNFCQFEKINQYETCVFVALVHLKCGAEKKNLNGETWPDFYMHIISARAFLSNLRDTLH